MTRQEMLEDIKKEYLREKSESLSNFSNEQEFLEDFCDNYDELACLDYYYDLDPIVQDFEEKGIFPGENPKYLEISKELAELLNEFKESQLKQILA